MARRYAGSKTVTSVSTVGARPSAAPHALSSEDATRALARRSYAAS
jgi:hypothetical protein